MRKLLILLGVALSLYSTSVYAQSNKSQITQTQDTTPLWMRYCSISPNGKTIAFTYKGDIYTVPVNGGKAQQLTTNPSYDSQPIWSPNSKTIAFTSDRMGSLDVYIINSNGGVPKRLTTYSGTETPIAFKNDSIIYISANIMPSLESRQFPSAQFSQVYTISTNEYSRPQLFSSLPMEDISINKDASALLFTDKKGYEDQWRKHHTSSITRDIWIALSTPESNEATSEQAKYLKYNKLSSFKGEDRNAVFGPDNKTIYYLSEQDGTFNIYSAQLNADKLQDIKQVTKFKDNPVRFLSCSNNGTLCFGYNGEIYTIAANSTKSQKVNIDIVTDNINTNYKKSIISNPRTSISAISKDGKQIAFIYKGDVYVTSSDYATTKQITDTPEQERDIDFSPDGRSVVYSSERDGLWQIYKSTIVNKEEKLFPYATQIKEEKLTKSTKVSFQPKYSPNGKDIAFLENRTAIMALNLESSNVRTIMDAKYEYSYSDGDQWFTWSPDSKWILSNSITIGGLNNKDVVLLDASGNGKLINLTKSGYNDGGAKWVLDGKAMIWTSDRAGYRSHGSWGSENDIYIMFFDLEAYEKFRMNKEELALFEQSEKDKKEENKDNTLPDKKNRTKKSTKEKPAEDFKALTFDLENAEYRIIRLTGNSSNLADAVLSPKGDKLYYLSSFESGMDLWVRDFKENSTKILVKGAGVGELLMDSDGKNIFIGGDMGLRKIDTESGKTSYIPCEFMYTYKTPLEREYIFEHTWRQVHEKFYDPKIHGIDWNAYKNNYARFIPHINNNYDFAQMLSEMLGELNGSHTGARYNPSSNALSTASLGVFVDNDYKLDGLKIKEIIKKSPLDIIKTDVTKGCIIEKIDGIDIKANIDYFPLLEGKSGKKVILSIYNPTTGKHYTQAIKAISKGAESELLYLRWIENNRKEVDSLSGGKIGYIHIKGMDSPSFRTLYSELLGRNRDKDAVVIDTRHNGGGWLHDDIITLLTGKEYQRFMPRGQYIGSDPYNKWTKASCMLVCEDNYSNAHGTPWLYKYMKVGKLVGAPVPGTMTAVWWERQIDESLVFGIPQVGCMDNNGNYLENQELEPDILVLNPAAEVLNGKDRQLEEAVKCLIIK